MGYRLSVSKLNEVYYGTKLFGYVDDESVLNSFKFLKDHEYITGDEFWTYSFDNAIVMLKTDFDQFRNFYALDLEACYGDLVSKDFLKDTEELTKLEDYEYVVLKWE